MSDPVTGADNVKPKRKRSWRRRLMVAGVAVLLLALIGRVIIAVAFPTVLHRVAGLYDLVARYSRMELSLLDGDVGLWDLTVTPKSGGEPLMATEYCRADVSALNLLRGRLVVRRAELDGTQLAVTREADGRMPAVERLLAGVGPPAPSSGGGSPPPPSAPSARLALDPPLRVDAVRVSRLRARWIDRGVAPPVDTELEMTLRLSDFGSTDRPTKLLIEATSPPLLDTLRIEGQAQTRGGGQSLDARVNVLVRGLHPRPAAGYLAPLGLRPVAESISLASAMTITARASTTRPSDVTGSVTMEKLLATIDGAEAAGVDRVAIDAESVSPSAVRLANVTVDGVRASAARTDTGGIRFAGLETMTPQPPSTRPAVVRPPPAPATTAPAGMPVALGVRELTVRDVRLSFRDDGVSPAADLALLVDQFTVHDVDSTRPDAPVRITGALRAPGVARSIRVSADARPFAPTRQLDGQLVAEGIRPDALRGYLNPLGVESTLTDATMRADLRAAVALTQIGRIDADARLSNIKFTDGGRELFGFDTAHVSGVSMDRSRVRVESVDLSGPRVIARRAADGNVSALGLRTKPTASAGAGRPTPATPAAAPSPVTASPASPLPRIELGRLTWKGVDLQLADDAVTPPTNVRINDAAVELSNIVLDLAAADATTPTTAPITPGRIRAWFAAPGVAEAFKIDGAVTPGGARSPLTADLTVIGTGLKADVLAPYLKSAGVEPALESGSLRLKAKLAATSNPDATANVSLAIDDFAYADGERELVGVNALRIDEAKLSPRGVAVGAVTLAKPRARLARNADGSFAAAGLRFNVPPANPTTAPAPAALVLATSPTSRSAPPAPAAFVATLGKLLVTDSALAWSDAAVSPSVEATARANVELNDFVFGRAEAAPATLKVAARIDQTLESFTADGTVTPSVTAPALRLNLAGTGMRQGALAPYLPPGTTISLHDGRFRARLEADVAPHAQGGQSAKLIVSDVDYRDGEVAAAPPPLLALEAARIVVGRADVRGKVIAIDEVAVVGLDTAATKSRDGSFNMLGVSFASAPPPPTRTPLPVATPVDPTPATRPTLPAMHAEQLFAAAREKLPLLTLDKLDVNLKRVALVDESNADGKPITLADVRLSNKSRIELLGDDPQGRPPVELLLMGRIEPAVGRFDVLTVAAPFASQPSLNVAVTVAGINGDGVAQVLPPDVRRELKPSPMTDGRFAAAIEATAKFAKRGPTRFDLTKPMEISAVVRDVAFRGDGDGNSPVLAGVDEVRADGVRVDPQTGSVVARSIEITKPLARAWRDADGIHLLGLVVREPTTRPATQPAPEPTPPPRSEAQLASVTNGDAAADKKDVPAPPPAELAIQKLTVSGIDVTVEDRTCDPQLVVPLNALEVEARGLSNLALYEPRPVRFNVTAGAAKVPLNEDAPPRELFAELAASGNLTLFPRPAGWARANVSGFELMSLRGPARAQKVEIGGGVFDGKVDVRLRDAGGGGGNAAGSAADGAALETRARFAFTDLRLSEPADGVIRRTLKLPAPLDAMIVDLQDASDAVTVPLNVTVKDGELSGGQIAGAAVSALGSVLATAMASAPLKVAGGVTDLAGGMTHAIGIEQSIPLIGGKKPKAGPSDAGAIDFYPGVDESAASVTLGDLIERLRRDRTLDVTLSHELGGGDVARAMTRANPPPDEAAALAAQLRQRKGDLLARRARLGPTARAMVLSDPAPGGGGGGGDPAGEAVVQLRDLDAQLAATEDALDRVYDLLRPGADRQAERRTRLASLELARQRLDAIKQLIVAAGVPDAENRVRISAPQFVAAPGDGGGRVTMVLRSKKKP
jgi:hypothetical protein